MRRAEDGNTRIAGLYQRAPCRILFPLPEADDPVQAVLLTTSGGLTSGDCTDVTLTVGPGAQTTVVTQSAERVYRALESEDETRMRVRVEVAGQAWAEWLAQETILFNGARLRRSFSADVAAGGRLLALETVVLGRISMGERFDTGLLHDSWRISRDGRVTWIDALRLDGDIARLRRTPFGLGMHVAYSTMLYVGTDAPQLLSTVRKMLTDCGADIAATLIDGILVVRAMAERADVLRATMTELACGLRHAAGSWPARLPRVWHC